MRERRLGHDALDDREGTGRTPVPLATSARLVSQMKDTVADPLDGVVDTMQRWLDGEPVWPYAKIIETWGPEFEMYRKRMFRGIRASQETGKIEFEPPDYERTLQRMTSIYMLRDQWVQHYGFAIPCAELLDVLAKAQHVVEVGAGTGYMTRLMRHRGISVTGSDPGHGQHGFEVGRYDEEQLSLPAKTMVRMSSTSTVFCSWPTLKAMWFFQMLKAMRIGQRLVVIRESACAEETAWEYLDACFDETSTIDIPTFEHMNDYASVHVKMRHRATSGAITEK